MVGFQRAAAVDQDRLQRVEIGEGAVGHRLIDQGPEPLGRLQLGGGRRQEDQIHAGWRHEGVGQMPARLVDNQHGAMGGVDALVTGEGGQRHGEGLCRDRRQQAPPALPRGRPHKTIDVEPFVAALDLGDRPLAPWRPHPAPHRQQAEAMLILGPQRDLGLWMGLCYGGNSRGKPPFLQASWATGSA